MYRDRENTDICNFHLGKYRQIIDLLYRFVTLLRRSFLF